MQWFAIVDIMVTIMMGMMVKIVMVMRMNLLIVHGYDDNGGEKMVIGLWWW